MKKHLTLGLLISAFLLNFTAPIFADEVALLASDRISAQARLDEGMADDVEELNEATYEYHNDNMGLLNMAMLVYQARRGKTTRLLIDALRNYMTPAQMAYAKSQGVQIKEFHPVRWRDGLSHTISTNTFGDYLSAIRLFDWSYALTHLSAVFKQGMVRLHYKHFIKNGNINITGSRNIGDRHFLTTRSRVARGDLVTTNRDIYVKGQAVRRANDDFMLIWKSTYSVEPKYLEPSPEELAAVEKQINEKILDLKKFEGKKPWRHLVREAESVEYINNNPLDEVDAEMLEKMIQVIDRAEKSVVIESPYFMKTQRLLDAFHRAKARNNNISIIVIVPARRSQNAQILSTAFEQVVPELLNLGAEVWYVDTVKKFHQKSLSVDGKWGCVVSHNFDPRSDDYNFEEGYIVGGEAFGLDVLQDQMHTKESAIRRLSIDQKDPAWTPNGFFPSCSARLQTLLLSHVEGLL